MRTTHLFIVTCVFAALVSSAPAGSIAIVDQIGVSPGFLATSASSSQFDPRNPEGVFATVDNILVPSLRGAGELVRLTQFQAVVTDLQNVVSFGLIESWNVRIYSSLTAAESSHIGDVYNATFLTPTSMTTGYSSLGELATFNIDAIVTPGEYWMTLTMGNPSGNGSVGIRHSTLGDGPAYFAAPSLGASFALAGPAAYRIFGESVPGPGGLAVLSGLIFGARRRPRA